jgi:hypothetical protein
MSKNTPAEESNPEDPGALPTDAEEAEPMNRAERRAKGKKGGAQGVQQGKGKFSPKSNQSHGPRLWANRRAG